MAKEIAALQKYMLSDDMFKSMMNEGEIRKSLDSITAHVSDLKRGSFNNDAALKTNIGLLHQHMTDTSRAFKTGNKPYARMMLQSSLQMCIACHTRIKTSDFKLPRVNMDDATLIEKAEFFYATRQFDKGKEVYESMIRDFPENMVGHWEIHRALLALAIYYTRIKEDPSAGAVYFKKVAEKNTFPLYLRSELRGWTKDLQDWSSEKKTNDTVTEAQFLAKAKKLLTADEFRMIPTKPGNFHIRRLRASALLHHVLETPGSSPAKGEALLYLGQIYHRIASSLFFRFGEMYLKACVQEYPKTKVAQNCYTALEQAVIEGYSGSAGTNLPEDEQMELLKLKRLAF